MARLFLSPYTIVYSRYRVTTILSGKGPINMLISRSALCSSVAAVLAGANTKGAIDWQTTILIESGPSGLRFASASPNGLVFVDMPADTEGDVFRVAVDALELSQLCSALKGQGEIVLTCDDGLRLRFKDKRGDRNISTSDTITKWMIGAQDQASSVVAQLTCAEIIYALGAAGKATEDNSADHNLGCVHVTIKSELVRFWSTDGRTAIDIHRKSAFEGKATEFSLPPAGCKILTRMLRELDADAVVTLGVTDKGTQLIASAGNTHTAKLGLDGGNRPKGILRGFDQLSSQNMHAEFTMSSSAVMAAIKEAMIGYNALVEDNPSVLLVFTGSEFFVLSRAASKNDMRVQVDIESIKGNPFGFAINARFAGIIINSAESDMIDVAIRRQLVEVKDGERTCQRAIHQIIVFAPENQFAGVAAEVILDAANTQRIVSVMESVAVPA